VHYFDSVTSDERLGPSGPLHPPNAARETRASSTNTHHARVISRLRTDESFKTSDFSFTAGHLQAAGKVIAGGKLLGRPYTPPRD
jgi:hypothetical protein